MTDEFTPRLGRIGDRIGTFPFNYVEVEPPMLNQRFSSAI